MPRGTERKGYNVCIVKFRENEAVDKSKLMFTGEIVLNMFEAVEDGIAIFNVCVMVAVKTELTIKDNT